MRGSQPQIVDWVFHLFLVSFCGLLLGVCHQIAKDRPPSPASSSSQGLKLTPFWYPYMTSTHRLQGGTDPVTDVNIINSS